MNGLMAAQGGVGLNNNDKSSIKDRKEVLNLQNKFMQLTQRSCNKEEQAKTTKIKVVLRIEKKC